MKSLKTILGIALATAGLGGTIAVGAVAGQQSNENNSLVKAATATTVYYAISSSDVGSYTVKCNINRQGDANNWKTYDMSKVAGKTYNGKDIYSASFTDLYDGLGTLQFQLYDGDTWKSQVEPISSWTGVSTYNGKIWENGENAWKTYVTDISTTLSVTFSSAVPSYVNICIPGAFNGWSSNVSDIVMTRSSNTVFTYSLSQVLPSSYEYKIVACYSGVETNDWTYQIDTSNKTVTISSSDSGKTVSLGSTRSYDFATNMPVCSLTLSVTFTSAVPDYVDIYLPGTFNSWSSDKSISKMTRFSNTVFTYSVSDLIPGSFQYKVVACYATASEMDYAHQVDSSDQSISITASDNGTTKSLGNRTYDFANKMKQQTVAEGAVITLTFTNAIPNTVDIVYVGSLTNWGTNPARISAGIMTANAQRKVFTWEIPSSTYVGTYEYKIVAMSKYTTADAVSYDHIVYGNSSGNESMSMDTSTTNYPLTGLEIDLVELATYSFSEGFNSAMAAPCANPNADNSAAVSAIWGTWKSTFEGMPSSSKALFGTSQGEMISQARSNYLHCVSRYNLATWTGAPNASQSINELNIQNNNTTIYVLIAVATSASLVSGLFFLFRKKKHN